MAVLQLTLSSNERVEFDVEFGLLFTFESDFDWLLRVYRPMKDLITGFPDYYNLSQRLKI